MKKNKADETSAEDNLPYQMSLLRKQLDAMVDGMALQAQLLNGVVSRLETITARCLIPHWGPPPIARRQTNNTRKRPTKTPGISCGVRFTHKAQRFTVESPHSTRNGFWWCLADGERSLRLMSADQILGRDSR